MQPVIFTMEQANAMIPVLSAMLRDIFSLNGRIKALAKDIEDLVEIWGKEVFEKGNRDHTLYIERSQKREEVFRELQGKINTIQAYGCFVKNIEHGLVDFLYECGGEYVHLCWKYGEPEIKFWHSMKEGFVGRRPISELLAISNKQ